MNVIQCNSWFDIQIATGPQSSRHYTLCVALTLVGNVFKPMCRLNVSTHWLSDKFYCVCHNPDLEMCQSKSVPKLSFRLWPSTKHMLIHGLSQIITQCPITTTCRPMFRMQHLQFRTRVMAMATNVAPTLTVLKP